MGQKLRAVGNELASQDWTYFAVFVDPGALQFNEVTPNDATGMESMPSSDHLKMRFKLAAGVDPQSSSAHNLLWRGAKEPFGLAGTADAEEIWVRLLNGTDPDALVVISETHYTGLNQMLSTRTIALSGPETDAIDWTKDLFVEVEANETFTDSGGRVGITWFEFQVPDAPSVATFVKDRKEFRWGMNEDFGID